MARFFKALGSLRLTVALLVASMVLVFFGTLDQTAWGIHLVQRAYFESWFAAYPLNPDAPIRLPMPGGFLIGGLLVFNLIAAHFRYSRPGRVRIGIAVTHAGVLLLVISGFVIAALQKETLTTIVEGDSANFSADIRECELALTDTTNADTDTVTVVPESLLRIGRASPPIPLTGTPFTLRLRDFFPNAPVLGPAMAAQIPDLKPVKVDNGIAAQSRIVILPRAENFSPNGRNSASAVVELVAADKTLGTWLVNTDIAGMFAPQTFMHAGRSYTLALRMKRTYFPFSIALRKFTHEKHPGTEIPKNFASDITLRDPREAAPRDLTISMNKPFRHDGFTFYQASFNRGGGTPASVLQTVRNPGATLPYVAITLVGIGMCLHFGVMLARFAGAKDKTAA